MPRAANKTRKNNQGKGLLGYFERARVCLCIVGIYYTTRSRCVLTRAAGQCLIPQSHNLIFFLFFVTNFYIKNKKIFLTFAFNNVYISQICNNNNNNINCAEIWPRSAEALAPRVETPKGRGRDPYVPDPIVSGIHSLSLSYIHAWKDSRASATACVCTAVYTYTYIPAN